MRRYGNELYKGSWRQQPGLPGDAVHPGVLSTNCSLVGVLLYQLPVGWQACLGCKVDGATWRHQDEMHVKAKKHSLRKGHLGFTWRIDQEICKTGLYLTVNRTHTKKSKSQHMKHWLNKCMALLDSFIFVMNLYFWLAACVRCS